MQWSRRVKLKDIRRLYRSSRLGIYDDEALKDVGGQLYDRCADIAAVATAFSHGLVPCPHCAAKVQRRIEAYYGLEGHGRYNHWFECTQCSKRLLWIQCRDTLRKKPRCFSCYSVLKGEEELRCDCGKKWQAKAYQRSVGTRVRLPCPHCATILRKPPSPVGDASSQSPEESAASSPVVREVECPQCQAAALHQDGNIECTACGYKKRWREYRKWLKRRDEALMCSSCKHTFKWQAWRREAGPLVTGNPQPARDFVERWPRCRTPQTRMMQIDFLLQTLHGQGPLAPLFIEGDEKSILRLLDELAAR
jgi:hypothetical protein